MEEGNRTRCINEKNVDGKRIRCRNKATINGFCKLCSKSKESSSISVEEVVSDSQSYGVNAYKDLGKEKQTTEEPGIPVSNPTSLLLELLRMVFSSSLVHHFLTNSFQ